MKKNKKNDINPKPIPSPMVRVGDGLDYQSKVELATYGMDPKDADDFTNMLVHFTKNLEPGRAAEVDGMGIFYKDNDGTMSFFRDMPEEQFSEVRAHEDGLRIAGEMKVPFINPELKAEPDVVDHEQFNNAPYYEGSISIRNTASKLDGYFDVTYKDRKNDSTAMTDISQRGAIIYSPGAEEVMPALYLNAIDMERANNTSLREALVMMGRSYDYESTQLYNDYRVKQAALNAEYRTAVYDTILEHNTQAGIHRDAVVMCEIVEEVNNGTL